MLPGDGAFQGSCFFFFSCPLGFASSLTVRQPANLLIRAGQEARLECFHGDSSYPYMYWYQHRQASAGRRAMELIGWLYYENANLQADFESRFSFKGQSKAKAWLEISDPNQTDSAEYFCAASQHSAATPLASSQKAGSTITTMEHHPFHTKHRLVHLFRVCVGGGGLLSRLREELNSHQTLHLGVLLSGILSQNDPCLHCLECISALGRR